MASGFWARGTSYLAALTLGAALGVGASDSVFDRERDPAVAVTELPAALRDAPYRNLITKYRLGKYDALSKMGVPWEKIKLIDPSDIDNVVYHAEQRHHPLEWLKNLGTLEDYAKHVANAVSHDPLSNADVPTIQSHIYQRLKAQKHVKRKDADYDEGHEQIKTIDDKVFLLLLKQQMDFFDSAEAQPVLSALLSSGNEEGGIGFFENGKTAYHLIPNTANAGVEKTNYHTPCITFTLPHIADIHSHPSAKGYNSFDTNASGPSGSRALNPLVTSDSSAAYRQARVSPYAINVVVSPLKKKDGKNMCNVDVYFIYQAKATKTAQTTSAAIEMNVFDIGVFEWQPLADKR